jgi:hypothetical protein
MNESGKLFSDDRGSNDVEKQRRDVLAAGRQLATERL